jgi:hypothetical protein
MPPLVDVGPESFVTKRRGLMTGVVLEDHGRACRTIVHMDDPTAPDPNAASTGSNRNVHRDQARR